MQYSIDVSKIWISNCRSRQQPFLIKFVENISKFPGLENEKKNPPTIQLQQVLNFKICAIYLCIRSTFLKLCTYSSPVKALQRYIHIHWEWNKTQKSINFVPVSVDSFSVDVVILIFLNVFFPVNIKYGQPLFKKYFIYQILRRKQKGRYNWNFVTTFGKHIEMEILAKTCHDYKDYTS